MLFIPFVLAGAVVIGGVALISNSFEEKTRVARKKYEDSIDLYYSNIENLKQQIEYEKSKVSWFNYNFSPLVELHYQSFLQANIAHNAFLQNKIIINEAHSDINEIKVKQNELYNLINTSQLDKNKRFELINELKQYKMLKNNLYENINNYKSSSYELSKTRDLFNQYTHNLKIYIRDNCGKGGKIWYEKLERRIALKNYEKNASKF